MATRTVDIQDLADDFMDTLTLTVRAPAVRPGAPGPAGHPLANPTSPEFRSLAQSYGLDPDLMGKMLGPRFADRRFKKEVEAFKKEANYLAAGKLLEDHGDLTEAVEAYTAGNEFWAAASVLERMGRGERAAEMYLQAGDHKKAAKVGGKTSASPVPAGASAL